MNLDPYFISSIKINTELNFHQNIIEKTLEFLEKKRHGSKSFCFSDREWFIRKTPKVQENRKGLRGVFLINHSLSSQSKSRVSKNSIKKVKRQPKGKKNTYLQSIYLIKDISKLYKEGLQLTL